MNKTQKYLLTTILGAGTIVAAAGGLVASNVNAQVTTTDTGSTTEVRAQRGKMSPENEAVRTAIENKDYPAWVTAVTNSPRGDELLSKVNEGNFARFIEMLEAQKNGDETTAETIRAELGLPTKAEMTAQREAITTALDNNDYEAWKVAMANSPKESDMLSKIDTEAKFQLLVEMHNNHERNEAISTELGLTKPQKGDDSARMGHR